MKSSGFALKGKTVNGYKTEDGNVALNVQSQKALESVVGHEAKHTLEKYGLNKDFNNILFEYAKAKGDLDTVRERIESLYKDQNDVDIDGEVAADLTGKYLFEDEKFLETLMKNKSDSKVRQAIEKIKEIIDDFVIRFKGTEQEKQLREVQKKFTELYNSTDADIVGTATEGTQYAIDNNSQGQYNLSRKNDYGDNINDFYGALNKEQWRDFYQQIADNGYLEYTDIGDIATVVIGNKLIVAERRTTGKDAHDFQVDDAYELVGTNDFDILYDIRNEIEESGVLNGNESITEKVFGVFKAASGKGNMYRFDRNKLRFVNHLTDGQNGNNDSKTNGISETKSNGQRVSDGNEQNIQGTEIGSSSPTFNYENETKAGSNESASSIGGKTKYSLSNSDNSSKDVFGFAVKENAKVNEDLLEELSIYHPDAQVDSDGNVTVYHRTSKENADKIRKTGVMTALEDALFFSSKSEGYASDYGDTVVAFKIPSTVLRINDIFDGEVHFDIPLKRMNNQWSLNVSKYLVNGNANNTKYSLSDSHKEKQLDIINKYHPKEDWDYQT